MENILGAAFNVSKLTKFKVKIYFMNDDDDKEIKTMTYLELGMFLVSKSKSVFRIDVIMRPN